MNNFDEDLGPPGPGGWVQVNDVSSAAAPRGI